MVWSPVVFTVGRVILVVPLKAIPLMFLGVWRAVAVAALPVIEPAMVLEKVLVPQIVWSPEVVTASVMPYPAMVVGFPVIPDQGALAA
jgi:hypothetical protein